MTRPCGKSRRPGPDEATDLEVELRDWLGRRAEEVTPATLRVREVPLPHVPVRRRRVPLRPAVSAAALALAAAGWALTTTGSDVPKSVTVPPAEPAPAATNSWPPPTPPSTPPVDANPSPSADDENAETSPARRPPSEAPPRGTVRSSAPNTPSTPTPRTLSALPPTPR
ncbi:hypothetical protein OG948_37595 (plasmid) [Embleya sp. NBC_00888]|uniref:hypothetical protein n=1 Tax=Embleya sp. NBC_00888 TaxID=2975960 RepID=UPI002F90FDA7|nr:hypothetical protein OG948_37595 [Embleya sp. NBC_00888]